MAFRRDLWGAWLRATLVRMVRTGAQAAIGAIGAAAVLDEVQWDVVGGVAALAMIVAFLTCLAGLPEAPSPINLFEEDAHEQDPVGPGTGGGDHRRGPGDGGV